jgi:alcohol dehydrogenase (cytochrome c)
VNWASGIGASGRPVRTGVQPSAEGTLVCPGFEGATNWYAPSFDPSSHLLFFIALEDCGTYFLKPQEFTEGKTYYSTGVKHPAGAAPKKTLVGYDVVSGKFAWRYPQVGSGRSSGGTMATAGGLVFFGDDAESFEAVDATTGAPLWHFHTGQNMHASPMSYEVEGKQYVAIASGDDLFAFALP